MAKIRIIVWPEWELQWGRYPEEDYIPWDAGDPMWKGTRLSAEAWAARHPLPLQYHFLQVGPFELRWGPGLV